VQAQKGKQGESPMALTILNNISSLTAENALSNTQSKLQNTLTQLSTGLKINSGSDDPAGLSFASGLTANIAALTQSQQNASNGIGLLQTADGALSQVTTLLNRAVTLATEGSTSGVTTSQATALNTEYTSILAEINQVGASTNFNGANVFTSNAPTTFTSTQAGLSTATTLTTGSVTTIHDSATGGTFVYTAGASSTVGTLQTAINTAVTNGTLSANTALTFTTATAATSTAAAIPANEVEISNGTSGAGTIGISVSSTDIALGAMNAAQGTADTSTVYIGDGDTTGAANTEISTTINALSATALGIATSTTLNLNSATSSQTALLAVTAAITTVSQQRGVIGASVNRLTAANMVMSDQVTNLQSAANSIQNADIGTTVANMTQYNVLESTGMAALQQSNQAQQAVLKLVQ
jgi:flagellin